MIDLKTEVIPNIPESGQLAKTLVDFNFALTNGDSTYEVLKFLADRCVSVLPISACGILIQDQIGILQAIAASSPSSHLLELFQIQNEEGPCYDCYRTGTIVRDLEVAENSPWPRYTKLARSKGILNTYALPLHSGEKVFGALNLFTNQELSEERILMAQALADASAIALLKLDPLTNLDIFARKTLKVIQERDTIQEAIGMIAQRFSISAEEALSRITKASALTDTSIIEVGRAIVSRNNAHPSIASLS